jgi:hypothetical protein
VEKFADYTTAPPKTWLILAYFGKKASIHKYVHPLCCCSATRSRTTRTDGEDGIFLFGFSEKCSQQANTLSFPPFSSGKKPNIHTADNTSPKDIPHNRNILLLFYQGFFPCQPFFLLSPRKMLKFERYFARRRSKNG